MKKRASRRVNRNLGSVLILPLWLVLVVEINHLLQRCNERISLDNAIVKGRLGSCGNAGIDLDILDSVPASLQI